MSSIAVSLSVAFALLLGLGAANAAGPPERSNLQASTIIESQDGPSAPLWTTTREPGEVIFNNGGPTGGRVHSSQLDLLYPFDAGAVDDFQVSCPASPCDNCLIQEVAWSGWYYQGGEQPEDPDFRITLWADDPVYCRPTGGTPTGQPPDYLVALRQYDIYGADANEVCDGDHCSYSAVLTPAFFAQADTTYWLEIQAVFPTFPQWGWLVTADTTPDGITDCYAHSGFDVLGVTFWSPLTDPPENVTFALTGKDGPCCETDDDCDDDNECTDDTCNTNIGECVYINNTDPCNDYDPCTEDDTCTDGVCVGAQKDCSYLNDDCNLGECDPKTGNCEAQHINEGEACDDGMYCNVGEQCVSGVCTGGQDRDCSDGAGCTEDSCDEEQDRCVNAPNDALCDIDDICDPSHPDADPVTGCYTPGGVEPCCAHPDDPDVYCPSPYGDIVRWRECEDGSPPQPDLDDIICIIDGFAAGNDWDQVCPCGDLKTTSPPSCGPDDQINLDDIIAVLDSFAGNAPCPAQCP